MSKEEEIIDFFRKNSLDHGAIGDDAAVVPFQGENRYVITQDSLVEDVHFRTAYCTMEDLAYKSLIVNISDIAAMGGIPRYLWLSLSFPRQQFKNIEKWNHAFSALCRKEGITIMGGDTTASPQHIYINITLIGLVHRDNIKRLSTAQDNDILVLCGHLGHAHLGLLAYEQRKNENFLICYKDDFLRPNNRSREGAWFGCKKYIHAMTDVSDGLLHDLKRMMKESKKTAFLENSRFPYSEKFVRSAHHLSCSVEEAQLTGGEDYGLLLSVDPHCIDVLLSEFKDVFNEDLTILGKVLPWSEETILFEVDLREKQTKFIDFQHF